MALVKVAEIVELEMAEIVEFITGEEDMTLGDHGTVGDVTVEDVSLETARSTWPMGRGNSSAT